MKRLMSAVITCTMALSGCSSEGDCIIVNPQPEENVTKIELNAGILGAAARTPASTDDNITALFMASTTDGDYATNAQNSTVIFVASPIPTPVLFFSPARHYPVDSSTIYIEGYYLAGTLTGKSVTLAADGTEDVMITAQTSGTKATVTLLSFIFSHLLAQLQFKFASGTRYPASDVNVTSPVIKQQKVPATLDLDVAATTYTTKGLTLSGTSPITTAGVTVSNYPMMKGDEALLVAATISDGVTYPETVISITTEAGEPYLIMLTFMSKEIIAAISVTAWQVGG